MLIQNLVERDADECQVRMAGIRYTFKRNEHGHLVTEVTDPESIKRMTMGNTAFRQYEEPVNAMALKSHKNEPETEKAPAITKDSYGAFPPYPQKGSKKPVKRSEADGNQQNTDRV